MYTQGVWWYRSIKYGHTNILLQTTQIFLYFMSKSKLLPVKREHYWQQLSRNLVVAMTTIALL